jgi:hypothetical protein
MAETQTIYDYQENTNIQNLDSPGKRIRIECKEEKQASNIDYPDFKYIDLSEIVTYEAFLSFKDSENNPVKIYYNKHNRILDDIDKTIEKITLPKKWEFDNISYPTLKCKINTKEISHFLYNTYKIIPSRIAASIEEGILIYYLNERNNRSLSIEIYNDLEIAAIVNDERNNKIIYNELIEHNNFEIIMNYFFYEQ